MPASNLLDLPSGVFLYIIDLLKGQYALTPLRLVCRSFNIYVCEAMFDTLIFNGGPCKDPLEWNSAIWMSDILLYYANRLIHQLDTLYTKKQPAALRRAKRLKIFVSGVFGSPGPRTLDITEQSLWRRAQQSAIHSLTTKLPSIIRTLGNLREITIYLSNLEQDEFMNNISNALLTLPHLSVLNISFLDQNSFRSLPIVGSPRLVTMRISWPVDGPDTSFFSEPEKSSIFFRMFGVTATKTSLKCLELRSANEQWPRVEPYQLCLFPYLEELVIDNVPVALSGDIVKEMKKLHSLRLAYGQSVCSNGEPCAEVWKCLREVGRKLKHLSVDTLGEALLTYLRSYAGLETLELTLGLDAEDLYVQDLLERSLRHHEESFKSLQVYLQPHSNPLSTWLFEYWKEWIPPLGNLERLAVTTSMNLFSEHDARVLVKNIADVVALIPTLRIVTVRHLIEDHPLFMEGEGITRVVQEGVQSTRLHRDYTTVPECVVAIHGLQWTFRVVYCREERYGSLRLICNHRD